MSTVRSRMPVGSSRPTCTAPSCCSTPPGRPPAFVGSFRSRPTRCTARCRSGASTETDELRPRNPYAASKAGADRLAYSFWATYELPVIITRASNNYGPRQFPEKLVPLFITNAIDNQPVPLYGDGQQVRDWLHVDDHCRALDLLLERGTPGEVYNIGGGNEVTNKDMTMRLLELVGRPSTLIEHVPDRPGHDRRYRLDTTKLRGRSAGPRRTISKRGSDRLSPGIATTIGGGVRSRTGITGVPRLLRRSSTAVGLDRPGLARRTRRGASHDERLAEVVGTVLVTGAAGFVGRHLLRALVDAEERPTRSSRGDARRIHGRHFDDQLPAPDRSRCPSLDPVGNRRHPRPSGRRSGGRRSRSGRNLSLRGCC